MKIKQRRCLYIMDQRIESHEGKHCPSTQDSQVINVIFYPAGSRSSRIQNQTV